MNGALLLSVVYLISGLATVCMAIYFLRIHGNGLKSILYHLFFSWAGHYLIVGTITLLSFISKHEVIPLDNLRMIAAFFVLLQFTAFCRLCLYIIKK
jgi:hypothetical protein